MRRRSLDPRAPLHVVVEATTWTHGRTGIGMYTERLSRALCELGYGDRVVFATNRSPGDITPRPEGAPVVGPRFPIRAAWMQSLLPLSLLRERPDVAFYPNYLAPVLSNVPSVVTVHDMTLFLAPETFTWKKRFLTRALMPLVVRRAEAIIAPSDATKRDLVRLLSIDPARVHVVPEAADPAFEIQPTEADTREAIARFGLRAPFVLTVGTLEPRKNHVRLIEAFERVCDGGRDVMLVLAGGHGWKDAPIVDAMTRSRHASRIVHTGYVDLPTLRALYGASLCLAYPSLYEGFGLPVVEAMAVGTPVLTSRGSSLDEVAAGAALAVDPSSVEEIADGLERMVSDAALREALVTRGRERSSQLSWKRAAEQTRAVLVKAAGRMPPQGRRPPRTSAFAPGEVPQLPDNALEIPKGVDPRDWIVLRTLLYADMFHYPLSRAELTRGLIGGALDTSEVDGRLAGSTLLRAHVREVDGLLCMAGSESFVPARIEAARQADALLAKHRGILDVISSLPFVRGAAFSGGTAFKNSPEDLDIDMLVVSERGRTSLTFLSIVVAMRLIGARDAVCVNYLLDEDKLALGEPHDFYTAHQLAHIVPFFGEHHFARAHAVNAWLLEHLPNARLREPEIRARERAPLLKRTLERALSPLWRCAEPFAHALLQARMRSKAKADGISVRVDPGELKLHVNDHRRRIMRRFEAHVDAFRARALTLPNS